MKLYRAFKEKKFAEKFVSRELMIRHLDYYRDLEDADNFYKTDPYEGSCVISENGEKKNCYVGGNIFLVCTSLYDGINSIRERHGKFIVQINDHERFANLLRQWGLNEQRKIKMELKIDNPGTCVVSHRRIEYYNGNEIEQFEGIDYLNAAIFTKPRERNDELTFQDESEYRFSLIFLFRVNEKEFPTSFIVDLRDYMCEKDNGIFEFYEA